MTQGAPCVGVIAGRAEMSLRELYGIPASCVCLVDVFVSVAGRFILRR